MNDKIVLINSNYLLKKVFNNPLGFNINDIFDNLISQYGNCVHTSIDLEVGKIMSTMTTNQIENINQADNFILQLDDYQIIKRTLDKNGNCILYKFSIPQVRSFYHDFSDKLDLISIYDGNSEIKVLDYLKKYEDNVSKMSVFTKPSSNINVNLELRYFNHSTQKCSVNFENSKFDGNFTIIKTLPDFAHNEVLLKILTSKNINYNIKGLENLLKLSNEKQINKKIKSILPDFLVYDTQNVCIGYGYNNTKQLNKCVPLKDYLNSKTSSNNNLEVFNNILDITNEFLCTVKLFYSYNILFYNMDLEDFKVITYDDGSIDILPINCEKLYIENTYVSTQKPKILNIDNFGNISKRIKNSEQSEVRGYQSYFDEISVLYMAFKIITLNFNDKNYTCLKNYIKNLKVTSDKSISSIFKNISCYFYDEIGDIFITNDGHFSIYNMLKLIRTCKQKIMMPSNKSLFNKFTKKQLFFFDAILLLLVLIVIFIIIYLIF